MKLTFTVCLCWIGLAFAEEAQGGLSLPTDAEWAALQGQGTALPEDALTAPTEEEWQALRPSPVPPSAPAPAESDFPLPDWDLPPDLRDGSEKS